MAPYLDLAREIRAEVERFTADDSASVESFAAALDAIPDRRRAELAREVFDRLPAEQQWGVLSRLFDDAELRDALAETHEARLADVRRRAAQRGVLAVAAVDGRLAVDALPPGTRLTLGLFRTQDVPAALDRGPRSDVCARRLELRAGDSPGTFRVIDDVFNPRGGLFVSAAYDQSVWRSERLAGHSLVRVGSLDPDATDGPDPLEPAVYLGARVDVEVGGEAREGRLHLGYALVADVDAFATAS